MRPDRDNERAREGTRTRADGGDSRRKARKLARSLLRARRYRGSMHVPGPLVLFDGHAPTPFTADQIRDASPVGHTTKVLIETKDDPPLMRTTIFVAVDETHAELQFVEASADDPSSHRTGSTRVRWTELQAHASFPLEKVDVAAEEIDLPWARLDCLRYTVADESGTTIHWFAREHPGMPVRTNVWNGSDLVQTATVLSIEDR